MGSGLGVTVGSSVCVAVGKSVGGTDVADAGSVVSDGSGVMVGCAVRVSPAKAVIWITTAVLVIPAT